LFLVLCVFGNEKREALVDATLLEELLKLLLEGKIESLELMETRQIQRKTRASSKQQKKGLGSHLRTDIESAAFPISLGGKVRRQFSIIIERHVVNDEYAFLANGIDAQCARNRWLIKTACQRWLDQRH
jgi:hypothetical protein